MPAPRPRLFQADRPLTSDPRACAHLTLDCIDDPRLSDGDKLVLGVLSYYARDSHPRTSATNAMVARIVDKTNDTVKRSIARLVRCGWCRREHRPGFPAVTVLLFDYARPFELKSDGLHAIPTKDTPGAGARGTPGAHGGGPRAPAPGGALSTTFFIEFEKTTSKLFDVAHQIFTQATEQKVRSLVGQYSGDWVQRALEICGGRKPRPRSWGYLIRVLENFQREGLPAPAPTITPPAAPPRAAVEPAAPRLSPEEIRSAFFAGVQQAKKETGKEFPELSAQNRPRGLSANIPPRAAGVLEFRLLTSVHDTQEVAKELCTPGDCVPRPCARQDLNLQPSDSKYQHSPENSAFSDDDAEKPRSALAICSDKSSGLNDRIQNPSVDPDSGRDATMMADTAGSQSGDGLQ